MLFKQKSRSATQGIILTSLVTLLASCGNSAALESLVSANPKLKENEPKQPSSQTNPEINSQPVKNSSPSQSRDALSVTPLTTEKSVDINEKNNNNELSENQKANDNNLDQETETTPETEFVNPSQNFLESFPVYPQAKLQEIQSDEENNSGRLVWSTTDNRQAVADFYQAELLVNDWEIIKPFKIRPQQKIARAIAVKDQLRIELILVKAALKSAPQEKSKGKQTQVSLRYQPLSQAVTSGISQAIESTDTGESLETATKPENQKPDVENSEQSGTIQDEFQPKDSELTKPESSNTLKTNNNYFASSGDDFADLDQVPEQLQKPLKSVAALSVLTPYTGQKNVELSKFAPNEVVTRGEYARWLITANNRYYSDQPGQKIYLAAKTDQPAFNDVKKNHPDFEAIQSLAEAGLIPSRLTEDSTELLFRPNAPLTREDLITWKVPLDTRKSLPKASIEAIEDSWGFQDAANLDSSAIRASYADFQNGDRSNIRRVFGYTTLFQPKKPVTRAEAAASLWYFGFQGDGITAKEVLESEN